MQHQHSLKLCLDAMKLVERRVCDRARLNDGLNAAGQGLSCTLIPTAAFAATSGPSSSLICVKSMYARIPMLNFSFASLCSINLATRS